MPIRAKAFSGEAIDGAFGKIPIQETTSAQNHFLLTGLSSYRDDHFRKRVMKFR